MRPLQQDIFDEAADFVRRTLDVLERHELRLRDFEDVKADENDPYSIDVGEVADAISLARDELTDALELMRAFDKNAGSGVEASRPVRGDSISAPHPDPLTPEEELADTIKRQKELDV